MTDTIPAPTIVTIAPTPLKPGWRSSETWLSFAALVLTAAFAVGLIGPTGTVAQVAGMIGMVLTAMGHAVTRTVLKAGAQ